MLYAVRLGRLGRWLIVLLALTVALATLVLLLLPPPALADGPAPPADSTGSVVPSTALWGLIVGAITPPLVAVIQQPQWSTRTRSIVGAVCAVGLAVVTCYVDGSIGHGQTLIITAGAVLVASQTTYRELWSKIGATQAIESATSPTPVEGGEDDNLADPEPAARKASTRKTTARKSTRRGS